jgi:uncharacterized Zn-binding protein involved in type VI secretion
MPAVTRQGDKCSGHGAFPSRPSVTGSGNVFCNGLPIHRQGDLWEQHCDSVSCHGGTLATGSGTVFANGQAIGRTGDPVSCGSTVAEGSSNVFAG